MGQVENLNLLQTRNRVRNMTHQRIRAQIQNLNVCKNPNSLGNTARQLVVKEQNFFQSNPSSREPEAERNVTSELVVGQVDHRRLRVPQALRKFAFELVVINKDGVESFDEEFVGNGTGKPVESQVQVNEIRDFENYVGKRAGELVVAEVELKEGSEVCEGVGDDAGEAVGVEVEERDVGEETEFSDESSFEVGMVEIYSGDDGVRWGPHLGLGVGAEDATVGADVGADPRLQNP